MCSLRKCKNEILDLILSILKDLLFEIRNKVAAIHRTEDGRVTAK
jgi:hypothetical protein